MLRNDFFSPCNFVVSYALCDFICYNCNSLHNVVLYQKKKNCNDVITGWKV